MQAPPVTPESNLAPFQVPGHAALPQNAAPLAIAALTSNPDSAVQLETAIHHSAQARSSKDIETNRFKVLDGTWHAVRFNSIDDFRHRSPNGR
jgi:hypothetical protein